MVVKDPRIDNYIYNSERFAAPILDYLRKLVHETCPDIEETIKWGMPYFLYHNQIICFMAAFKAHCIFGFRHQEIVAELAHQKLENKAMGQFGRITSLESINTNLIVQKLKHAMTLVDEKP